MQHRFKKLYYHMAPTKWKQIQLILFWFVLCLFTYVKRIINLRVEKLCGTIKIFLLLNK